MTPGGLSLVQLEANGDLSTGRVTLPVTGSSYTRSPRSATSPACANSRVFHYKEGNHMAIPVPTTRNTLPDTIQGKAQPPVPIGYTASGSGGINLALSFLLYMIAAGRGRRLQPPLFVNYNEAEKGRIWAFLSYRGRRLLAVLPRHIHRNPEGFGGNPTAWK